MKQKVIRANLKASGYQVVMVSFGEDGLAAAQKEMPDLIMFDVKMQGMSGWDVLKAIRGNEDLRGIPVIVMTAYSVGNEQKRAESMGARSLLSKPFSVKQMMEHVRLAVEKKAK
jgi:CheY-like chemotaxis protein